MSRTGLKTTIVFQENSDIKMDFVIEPLTSNFAYDVSIIEAECFSTPFKESDILAYLKESYWHFFVARRGEEILGYISFTLIIDEISICNVAVSKKYRNQKIASNLINALLDFSKKNEVKRIFLEVRESNNPAISLYEKFGFVRVGISKNHYTLPKENAILMNLEI